MPQSLGNRTEKYIGHAASWLRKFQSSLWEHNAPGRCVPKDPHHQHRLRNINKKQVFFLFCTFHCPLPASGWKAVSWFCQRNKKQRKWEIIKSHCPLKVMNCRVICSSPPPQHLAQLWTQRRCLWRWNSDPTLHTIPTVQSDSRTLNNKTPCDH